MPRHPWRVHHCFVRHAHAARQPGHQLRLQRVQLRRIDRFGMQAGRRQAGDLGRYRRQFVRIAGHPQRAAAAEFRVAQRGEALPQVKRIRRQRQLGRVVVHRDQVPHRRCGGTAADRSRLGDRHAQPFARRGFGAGRAHDAGADHDQVVTASRGSGRRCQAGSGVGTDAECRPRRRSGHRSRRRIGRRRGRHEHPRGCSDCIRPRCPRRTGRPGRSPTARVR